MPKQSNPVSWLQIWCWSLNPCVKIPWNFFCCSTYNHINWNYYLHLSDMKFYQGLGRPSLELTPEVHVHQSAPCPPVVPILQRVSSHWFHSSASVPDTCQCCLISEALQLGPHVAWKPPWLLHVLWSLRLSAHALLVSPVGYRKIWKRQQETISSTTI